MIRYVDTELLSFVEHMQARTLQDALSQATASHWSRRAAEFEAAKPTLSDNHGEATKAELGAKWRELDAIARACRARAEVSLVDGRVAYDVHAALDQAREVA